MWYLCEGDFIFQALMLDHATIWILENGLDMSIHYKLYIA